MMNGGNFDNSGNKFQHKSSAHHGIKGIFRLTVWIPSDSVGKVIGKKGAVITHIQRETQTEVVVLPIPPESTTLWCPICITGDPQKAINAYNTVKDIVEEIDDVVAEFPFPKHKVYHGLLYGNHHEAVKRLSADTAVRINVPDGNFASVNSHITLEGSAEGVFKALEKYTEVIADPSNTSHKNVSAPSVTEDGSFESIVNVPVSIVGLLLVRRGTDTSNVLFQIRNATNTYIVKQTVDRKKEDTDSGPAEEEDDARPRRSRSGHETFCVLGAKEEDVVLAATCITRMVDGEKIYSVMSDLRSQRPEATFNGADDSGNRHFGGRGRGGDRDTRGGRGRGSGGRTSFRGEQEEDSKWGHVRLGDASSSSGGKSAPHKTANRKGPEKGDVDQVAAAAACADVTDEASAGGSSQDRGERARRGRRGGGGRGGGGRSSHNSSDSRDQGAGGRSSSSSARGRGRRGRG